MSPQTVHVHRNSSSFPMCWADPMTPPVQPPLPFTIQQTSVCVVHSTPLGELGVQASTCPGGASALVWETGHKHVTRTLDEMS